MSGMKDDVEEAFFNYKDVSSSVTSVKTTILTPKIHDTDRERYNIYPAEFLFMVQISKQKQRLFYNKYD